ncbi:hypothetical protein BC833DRAFT_620663 [Globomyces pollinis-pini]|nr:hypothetical protein BC833DRAFT_620663 [Globomyces pollinis-pini]
MVEVYWKLGCFLMNSACYSPYIILLYFRTTCMFVLAKPWERQLIKYLSILGIIAFNVGSLGVFMPLNMEQYQTVYGISSIFASMFVFVNDIFYMVRFQRLLKISKNPPMASLKNDNNQVPRIIAQYGAVMIILQLVCLFNYIARVALQERLFDIPSNFCQVTGYTTLFAMKFKLDQIKSS